MISVLTRGRNVIRKPTAKLDSFKLRYKHTIHLFKAHGSTLKYPQSCATRHLLKFQNILVAPKEISYSSALTPPAPLALQSLATAT